LRDYEYKYFLGILLVFSLAFSSWAADLTLHKVSAQVYFSPCEGCTQAIIDQISKAKSEILIQAYSFLHPKILMSNMLSLITRS